MDFEVDILNYINCYSRNMVSSKVKLLTITATAIVLAGCTTNVTNNNTTTSSSTSTASSSSAGKIQGYTMSDVAMHASASDCWMAINGKVYNVTNFIGQHPGGSVIVTGCGKDATQLFATQGNTGGDHSSQADQQLAQFEIGVLN
jgi:cytochrome b involved in lipid metabolism